MRRCGSIFLSLSLALLMFPTSALVADGDAYADPLVAQSELQASSANSTPATSDVKHTVSKTIGTKQRAVPQATDFHQAFGVTHGYPAYDGTFNADVTKAADSATAEAQELAVKAENTAIFDYDAIDEGGNLYKNGARKTESADGKTVTKLVRHTAGVNNYGETIPDSTPATITRLSLRMVRYGNVVTGLYAPPGEVVKVTLRSTSSNKAPEELGLQAQIGNYSGNAHTSVISNTEKYNLTRMPDISKTLALDKQTTYIGSPLGGAILIYSNGIGGTTVEMEIEGAIEMPTYFYGESPGSESSAAKLAEIAEQLQKPGPYFAFSTPRGVRAVGPSSIIRDMDPAKLVAIMEFWDKAVGLSLQFEAGPFDKDDPDTNLMVEMFDPHIPAGIAVNMGQWCICPVSWGKNFLDINQYVSGGGWGAIHELNHSFPWGGAIDGMTEISNNVINAMTYQLYTNIAANRYEPTNRSNPSSGGLDGWNWCTDMYTTMERLRLNKEAYDAGKAYPFTEWNLGVYVPLQHRFGADRFLEAVHLYHKKGGKYNTKLTGNELYTNSNVWMRAASEACGMNMGYYMRDIQFFPELATGDASQTDYITTDVRTAAAQTGTGPVYIPSGCLYASGFVDGDEVTEMGRPFRIPYGQKKILNLNSSTDGGYISVANGETVEVTSCTNPAHGGIVRDGNVLVYTPDPDFLEDTFDVTVKLTITKASDPAYVGLTQDVTYRISLLQDTSQYGFTTAFYDHPETLANYDDQAKTADPLVALANNVSNRIPSSMQIETKAGFDGPGKESAGRFAVVEGALDLPKTGDVELNISGNVYFTTCFAASHETLPAIADAQQKKNRGGNKRVRVYVIPAGSEAPANTSAYAAVVNQGEPLYVRAYVGIPYDCTGRYRIGYVDNGTVKDFDASALVRTAPASLETPAVSDYTVPEKAYSYPDPTFLETALYDYQPENMHGATATAWKYKAAAPGEGGNDYLNPTLNDNWEALGTYGGNGTANIIDGYPEETPEDRTFMRGNLKTHFHSATAGQDFPACFIIDLPGESGITFNTIRYKGHADFEFRGKIRDYEVWVGNDRSSLHKIETESSRGRHGYDYEEFNMIDLKETVTAKCLCIVAKNCYPANGQYYYAFADLSVGMLSKLTDAAEIFTDFTMTDGETGAWAVDTETLVNTRCPIKATDTGTGTFKFTGTGVIIYSTTSPDYGKMLVTVDGGTANETVTEVDLCSSTSLGQQAVFWKSFINSGDHVVKVEPKTKGTDRINIENFEVTGTKASANAINERKQKTGFYVEMSTPSVTYTGTAHEPKVTPYYKGENVTDLSSVAYYNNTNAGTAAAVVTLQDESINDGHPLTAVSVFNIEKISHPGTVTATASLGTSNSYKYGQATLPTPTMAVTGTDLEHSSAFYYSATENGEGRPWEELTTTALATGTYYLWGVATFQNHVDVTSPRVTFTIEKGETYNGPSSVEISGGVNSYRYEQEELPMPELVQGPRNANPTFYYSDSETGEGELWSNLASTASLALGDYYVWAKVSSPNYENEVTTPPTRFTVKKGLYSGDMSVSFPANKSTWAYGQAAPIPSPTISGEPDNSDVTLYYSGSQSGARQKWTTSMTSTSFIPGTYYLWGVAESQNYEDVTTARVPFTVTQGQLSTFPVTQAKTYPSSIEFPLQAATGTAATEGVTLDIYVKPAATGSWTKKLSNLSPKAIKGTITGLAADTAYQYRVRASKAVDGKTVAASEWTSGTVKTGPRATPAIKSVKTSSVRVKGKGKKATTSYKLKVTLKKKLPSGAKLVSSDGLIAKGKGKSFTFAFKNIAGKKKGKSAKISVRSSANTQYGAYSNLSKAKKYKIK